MERGAGIKQKRPPAMTLSQLSEEYDVLKQELVSQVTQIDCEDLSEVGIRDKTQKIKSTRVKYETINKKLCSWYSNNGSATEARECRTERINLVYTECSDAVRHLNSALREMGLEAASSIGKPSISPKAPYTEQPNTNMMIIQEVNEEETDIEDKRRQE